MHYTIQTMTEQIRNSLRAFLQGRSILSGHRRFAAVLVVLLQLVAISEPTAAQVGASDSAALPRTALVIGNAAYSEAPLRNPANDANDVASMLTELGFDVTQHTNLDHKAMEDAIRAFGLRLRRGGVGLFYYAGHAVQVDGRNYLLPLRSGIKTRTDVKYHSVDLGFLLDAMGDANNSMNLVILDACRNNPFRWYRGGNRGLAQTPAPMGTLIAFSTAPGSVAADGDARNGVFTQHLLDSLQLPGLQIEEVLKRTRAAVMTATSRRQVPWENSSIVGELVLRPGAINPPPPPPLRAGDVMPNPPPGMRFRYIPPGTFQMGSPSDESGRDDDETRHSVMLTRGYWMSETEITQAQWQAVMGNNPAYFQNCGETCPVEQVNWFEAVTFANRLSAQEGLQPCYVLDECTGDLGGGCTGERSWSCTGDYACSGVRLGSATCSGYRLPTEAEWERAARSGTETAIYTGALTLGDGGKGPELKTIAWFSGNAGGSTHPVGQKASNAWGLRDMLGNVREWTWDWYGSLGSVATTDPLGPVQGSLRVRRGGSWNFNARYCRAANRFYGSPGYRTRNVGFRLVRTAP